MNDDRDGGSGRVPQPVNRGTEPAEIEFFRELIRLEDRRLDEARRRTALAERALELNDEQDRRQAEYATLDLELASAPMFAATSERAACCTP